MKKRNNLSRILLQLAICILILCSVGCTEEKEDDLKNLTLETEEETAVEEEISEEKTEKSEDEIIYVYVCGAVKVPGVYKLQEGARIYEVIICAGGFADDAAQSSVNQAQILSDGEQIYIQTVEEFQQNGQSMQESVQEAGITSDGKVNINTATKEELMTLSGIGESRAERIISYRETNGAFQSVEDLMNVEGIKDGIFQKVKDSITVNSGS